MKRGDILNACVKCQGLKKGEKIEVIRQIKVTHVGLEQLFSIAKSDVISEGFSGMTTSEFVKMFIKANKGCTAGTMVNRIEFEYVN